MPSITAPQSGHRGQEVTLFPAAEDYITRSRQYAAPGDVVHAVFPLRVERVATTFVACASDMLVAGIGVFGMPFRMMPANSWSDSGRRNCPRPRSIRLSDRHPARDSWRTYSETRVHRLRCRRLSHVGRKASYRPRRGRLQRGLLDKLACVGDMANVLL